jgi:5-methylcytosine-specific restriction endonuclease McrA
MKGKTWNHTKETRKHLSKIKNEGKKRLNQQIRANSNYLQWRSDVFKRDNYACNKCGAYGCYLEAHHIIPLSEIIKTYEIKTTEQALNCEAIWDIGNGVTLCESCHIQVDKYKKQFEYNKS